MAFAERCSCDTKIPASEPIIDNFDVFDFELSKDDMDRINKLNRNMRSGADPDTLTFSD